MEQAQTPEVIDVGANVADGDIRLWRAKEAMRQGELRLSEQTGIRTALEARATAITGWASASLLAVAAAIFTAPAWPTRAAGMAAAVALFATAAVTIHTARPRDWGMRGYDPRVLLEDTLPTELEGLESLAKGFGPAIQMNHDRIEEMGRRIRLAGRLLIFAPVIAGVAYLTVGRW